MCCLFLVGTISFDRHDYEFYENDGPAKLVLRLSKPLECCSFSVQIEIIDVTAIGKFVATYIQNICYLKDTQLTCVILESCLVYIINSFKQLCHNNYSLSYRRFRLCISTKWLHTSYISCWNSFCFSSYKINRR